MSCLLKKLFCFLNKSLVIIIFSTSFGHAHDLLCWNWLEQLYPDGNSNSTKGSNCSSATPSPRDGDKSDCYYQIEDRAGVAAVCRDFMPTWGEREAFYRTSLETDRDKIKMKVKRQYCWARNIIIPPNDNCGGPKYKFPWWSFDNGVSGTNWGGDVTLDFTLNEDDMGKSNAKTIFSGANYAYIEYKKVNGEEDPRFVCAYFKPGFWGKIISMKNKEIGCIQLPLRTLPVYNKTLAPAKSAVISQQIPNGSTFETPKITLNVLDENNQISQAAEDTVTLKYDFKTGEHGCEELLGNNFCPKISDNKEICAYMQENGNLLGCVPRPTPQDSKFKFEVLHDFHMDPDCKDKSGNSMTFHAMKIKMIRPDGSFAIFPKSGSTREYFACYEEKLEGPCKYVKGQEEVDVYGVKFQALIPEFTDSTKTSFKKIFLQVPIINTGKDDVNQNSCDVCFQPPTGDGRAELIAPAGDEKRRDRDSCQMPMNCVDLKHSTNKNIINQQCMFGYKNEYNEIERAYCYGIYRVNILANDTPADQDYLQTADKICMKKKVDDWPNFFLGTQKGDKYCIDLPNSYMKFDENNIGPITKFVDFSGDGFDYKTKYKPEQELKGKCDAIFGLEEEKVINTKAIKQGNLSDIELSNLKNKISAIEENLNKNNANLSGLTKDQLTILGYSSVEAMQGDSLGQPTRQLNGNVPIGNIAHGCRFVSGDDGCAENTETTEFLGHATFKLPDNQYQTGYIPDIKNVDFEVDTANNLKAMKLEVSGICVKGYKKTDDLSFPKRICRVILDAATNKVITKAWEGRTIEDACVPE